MRASDWLMLSLATVAIGGLVVFFVCCVVAINVDGMMFDRTLQRIACDAMLIAMPCVAVGYTLSRSRSAAAFTRRG